MITPKKATGIRMPEELNERITSLADFKGVSKNAVMLEALWNYFENKQISEVKNDSN